MGNVQTPRQVKVLMLGLDGSGKTTILYKLRLGETITAIPTIGFNAETVEYQGVDFTIWETGGSDKVRRLWRNYYPDTEVLIFVVDSNDRERIGECREALLRCLNDPKLANVPLLVMANKQDLPNPMNVAEVTDKLGLHKIRDRKWYVQATVITGDGLYEGLEWIVTTLKEIKRDELKALKAEKDKAKLEAEKEKKNLEAEKEKKKKEDDQEAEFIRGVEEAIAKSGKINRKLAHFMFVGPPGSGKSSLMDRLLGRLRKEFSCSTGVCDSVVIVDIDITKPSALYSITIVDAKDWKEVECQASFVGQMDQKNIIVPEQPEQDKAKSPLNGAQGLEKESKKKKRKLLQKFKKKSSATPSSSLLEAAAVAVVPKENITSVIKMYDSIDSFLKKSAQGKKTCSLYFRDTGGQVEFQEMLGLLIFGPSIFFFIFRLDLDFTSKFVIKYRKSASESINTYTSSITTEEALLQSLASVYAMDTSDESTIKTHKPLVYIIGTHKDNLGPSADDKIEKLNQYLDSLIINNGFQGLVQYADEKKCQVMLTVDNTSPSDEDFASIRSKVTNLITIRNEFNIEYPVSYLVFCLEVQNIKESILSLDECRRLAAKYGIEGDQVLHLLHFLHIRIGIIQHFNVEGLSHIVVKEPQVLFNKVTDLVIQTFSSSSEGFAGLTTEEARNLRKGILAASVFKSVINVDDKISHEDFLRLLVHLRIITPFKTHEEDEEKRYFIPCVLNHVSESSEMDDLETEISSLAVGFKSPKGTFHCPKGIFGILVTHIMTPDPDVSSKCNTTFNLLQDKIFKDQVSFKVHSYGNRDEISVKITSSYLEIKFYPKSVANRDASVGEVCSDVREIVEKSVLKSLKDLHYNRARIEPTTCLKCEDCGELHQVVRGKQFHRIFCTKAEESRRLPPNGRYWYNEAVDDKPPSPPPADPASTLRACLTLSDHFQVTQSLNDLNNEELQLLGGALGLHQPKLERMKTLPDDMVQAWLRADDNVTDTSGSPSWESLAAALEACHHNGVASNIRKKHLQDQH